MWEISDDRRQHRNCSMFALSFYQTVNIQQEGWEEKYHHVSVCLPSALPLNSIESQYIFISLRPRDLLILLQPTCGSRRGLFFWQTAKVDFVRNHLRLLAEFPPATNYQLNIRDGGSWTGDDWLFRCRTFFCGLWVFLDSWNVIIVAPN